MCVGWEGGGQLEYEQDWRVERRVKRYAKTLTGRGRAVVFNHTATHRPQQANRHWAAALHAYACVCAGDMVGGREGPGACTSCAPHTQPLAAVAYSTLVALLGVHDLPVVFDGVVCASRQVLGDLRPLVAELGMLLNDGLFLGVMGGGWPGRVREG